METNKPLNELLKNIRIERNISVEQIFEDTYIPAKFIKMIEEGTWSEFPSEVHLKGYIRLYSTYLKIDSATINKYLNDIMSVEEEVQDNGKNNSKIKNVFPSNQKKFIFIILILLTAFVTILALTLKLIPK
ncbi:helix-turn-helix domain-containing protein [bacterium]|nr:helix-turn-helix domain-containing protein [bacterium]